MLARTTLAAAALCGLMAAASSSASAAVYMDARGASAAPAGTGTEAPILIQHWHGRPGYRGGPGWGYRPWYRRPYYGTIIAGVALGTIIGVTAYGLAPPRPRPDLCWYWVDREMTRGYWDYC